MSLCPGQPVPQLDLPCVGGDRFNLQSQTPKTFTMLVVYRGLHCPICKSYLKDLSDNLPKFSAAGCDAIALTSDPENRASQAHKDWELVSLPLAYDMPIEAGRQWGLAVSKSMREAEPDLFLEPGVFLVKPDATLFAAWTQTVPFARPAIDALLRGVQFVQKNSYPARGTA